MELWDLKHVDISIDYGLSWINIRPNIGGSSGGWVLTTLDITEFAGQEIMIRFYFDSLDGLYNHYEGWFVDDVIVYSAQGWLISDMSSGSIPAGSSQNVQITFDAAGRFGGDYLADILILSNDLDENEVIVPASLTVTGVPDIDLNVESLDFGQVFVDGIYTQLLTVTNLGTDLLTVSNIENSNADFEVNITSLTLDSGESYALEVSFTPTETGDYEGSLAIVSNDPNNPEIHVSLSGNAMLAPDIDLNVESLSDSLFTGEVSTHQIVIENIGGLILILKLI